MGKVGNPMIRQNCPHCGVRYSLPESAAGKQAKCKQCGEVFTVGRPAAKPKPASPAKRQPAPLPEPKPKPEDDGGIFGLADDFNEADGRAAEDADAIRRGQEEDWDNAPEERPRPARTEPSAAKNSYLASVVWSFAFPVDPSNLFRFLGLWLVLLVGLVLIYLAGRVPLFFIGTILQVIVFIFVFGWFCHFRLETVEQAAANDDQLPDVKLEEGWHAEFFIAFFTWVGTWAAALLPALALLVYTLYAEGTDNLPGVRQLAGGWGLLQALPRSFQVLLCLGLFAWPMIVLCVAMGGFSTLARPDLILLTLLKTFPAYVATVVLVFGSVFLGGFLSSLISVGGVILPTVLQVGVTIYLWIVAMRCIGLYYHHFKHRFAWSWG